MDEIINYLNVKEEERDSCLNELLNTSFRCPDWDIRRLKTELARSRGSIFPQLVLVRRDGHVIGYLFLRAEKQDADSSSWIAVENSDELPIETDLRLLAYGAQLCTRAGYPRLAGWLEAQRESHRNGIGRRPAEDSL